MLSVFPRTEEFDAKIEAMGGGFRSRPLTERNTHVFLSKENGVSARKKQPLFGLWQPPLILWHSFSLSMLGRSALLAGKAAGLFRCGGAFR